MKIEIAYTTLKTILKNKDNYYTFKEYLYNSIFNNDYNGVNTIVTRLNFDINPESEDFFEYALRYSDYKIIKLLIDTCDVNNHYCKTYLIEHIIDKYLEKNNTLYVQLFKDVIDKFDSIKYALEYIYYFTNFTTNIKMIEYCFLNKNYNINDIKNEKMKNDIIILLRKHKLNNICQ